MEKIGKGTIFTIAFTIIFNLGCLKIHYKVLERCNRNQRGLQAIVDYKRKKLDEEWEKCNEIMEGMGGYIEEHFYQDRKGRPFFYKVLYS